MIEIRNGYEFGEPIAWLPTQYGGHVPVWSRERILEAIEQAIGPQPVSPILFAKGVLVVLPSPFSAPAGTPQTPVTAYDQSEDAYNAARLKKYEDDKAAWCDWRDYVLALAKQIAQK